MQEKKRFKNKRVILISVLLVVVIVGGLGAFFFLKHRDQAYSVPPLPEPNDSNSINYDPPTPEEKAQASDKKDEIVSQQNQPPTPGQKTVTLTVVDASQYGQSVEVRAFANEVVENSGQCTFTFTQAGKTVTKQTAGVADATTTRCSNLAVPRSEFPSAGTWNLTIAYASPTAKGSITSKVDLQ